MQDIQPGIAALADVRLGGLLGEALEANRNGRLSHFITDEHSPAIQVFSPEARACNTEGDWYGEHAGKWLHAAARSAARSGDTALRAKLLHVAHYLASVQEADGYLGTYAPERRFMRPQPPKPGTWDGAPSVRTWDIWTHSYLILGLLEVHRHLADERSLQAARRIGDLCWQTLSAGGIDINELGNHHGMSATVLMDPAIELYRTTGEQRYLDLALLVLRQADANPALALVTRALQGADASEIATGKAYQLAWNLVGLAKLHRATGDADLLRALDTLWNSIRDHHLTLGGGPWGGVAHRSREVFNPAGVFSPHGYVETCSILAWIQLNRELLLLTGQARYAQEIERTAYNDLIGAMAPDGEDWCYYSFPNGRRVHTTYWRCCKSSGAMAVEELPQVAWTVAPDGALSINLLGPGQARFDLGAGGWVTVKQLTDYPFDGLVRVQFDLESSARLAVQIRVPDWAAQASLSVNGEVQAGVAMAGGYARVEREWQAGDEITLQLPMAPRLHRQVNQNIQESRAPDGSPVRQLVLRQAYVGVSRGPLVYATPLIDGYKTEETVRLEQDAGHDGLSEGPAGVAGGRSVFLHPCGREPLELVPYYRAGGRQHGSWRLTWLSVAPDSESTWELHDDLKQ